MSEFAPGSTTATATLSGLSGPFALTFDAAGNLFVANNSNGTVSEFTPASYTPSAGGVVIRTAQSTEAMSIGGGTAPANTLSLTNAELARIFTTASGTVTVGDSSQTGAITFHTATVATTPGASTMVVQSTTGPGGILLDDSNGTALDGNGGTVRLSPGTAGISAALSAGNTLIASNGFTAAGLTLNLSLNFAPTAGQHISLIDDAGSAISGAFSNLTAGDVVSLSDNGTSYPFIVSYKGGTGHNLVLTEAPMVQFSASTETVNQSDGTFRITVDLSLPTTQDVTVDFAPTGGTAQSGIDYTNLTSSPLTIVGDASATITGTLPADFGQSQTLQLTLSNPTNAGLGTTTVNTLTIREPQPTVYFDAASETVDQSAGTFSIPVDLSHASNQDVTVDFAPTGGSAVSGTDYSNLASSPLTIPAGDDSATISGTLPADYGQNQTLQLTLRSPSNASLGSDDGEHADDHRAAANGVLRRRQRDG